MDEKETIPTQETEPENIAETGLEDYSQTETVTPRLFVLQTIIVLLLIMAAGFICRSEHPWLQWARVKLHIALNASAQNTFGMLSDSPALKNVMQNCSNFIRLEELTKDYQTQKEQEKSGLLKEAAWPVTGRITKDYGWKESLAGHIKEFNPGVEFQTLPGTMVNAIAAGTVSEINRLPGQGWQIMIDHGSGWRSIYSRVAVVTVKTGQTLSNGAKIGHLSDNGKDGKVNLLLEIKHWGQTVDPMSILMN